MDMIDLRNKPRSQLGVRLLIELSKEPAEIEKLLGSEALDAVVAKDFAKWKKKFRRLRERDEQGRQLAFRFEKQAEVSARGAFIDRTVKRA